MNTLLCLGSMLWRALSIEPLWLVALGLVILLPGTLIPPGLHTVPVVLLLLFWSLRWLAWLSTPDTKADASFMHRLLHPLQSPLSLSLLGIVAWLPINVWAAVDQTVAWIALGHLLYGIAWCVALINWPPTRRHPELIAAGLGAAGVMLALAAPFLVQFKPNFRLFYLSLYDQLQRLTLTQTETIHANVLAGALVLVVPLLVAVTVAPRRGSASLPNRWEVTPWLRVLTTLGGGFILSMIVLTQSRGAYLASAAAFAVIVLLRWPKLLWGILPLSIAVLVLHSRFDLLAALDALSRDGSLSGWEGRLDIWQNSLLAISDFSFTGIGIGTFTIVLPLLYPLRFSVESYPHAHNYLLQVGLDLGVPGLIAFGACILNVLMMAGTLYVRRRSLSPLTAALVIGSIGALVGILVHGIFDAVLWGTKLAFLPWILFALVTTLYLRKTSTSA